MTRRQQLTEVQLAALYDAPAEQRELVRHYTLSEADLAAVGRCRGDHNRLGFALMLCYLRHPGRPIRTGERPPAALVAFVAEQIDVLPEALDEYLRFDQNRRRHSTELQERLRLRPYGTVRIADIIRFVLSAPTSPAELDDEAWQQRSFMCEAVLRAATQPLHPLDAEAMERIVSYFRDEFARQDVKLRTSITSTLSTSLDRFTHGRLKRLFCEETSFVPELTLNGAILILNMPVLEWNEDGLIAQQIIKYAWQRIVLSRNALPPPYRDRLVCCFVDEAQSFLNSYDREFLSLSRSSRCSSIYITQSIPSVIATIGGEHPKHQADALLAQFGTKVFCNNSCPETNRFAADTIGRTIQRRSTFSESESSGRSGGLNMGEGSNSGTNSGVSISPDGKGGVNRSVSFGSSSGYNESTGRNRGFTTGESVSNGFSEAMDYEIEPGEFARSLLTGPPNGIVSCVWFQAGRRFAATGRPWLVASFRQ